MNEIDGPLQVDKALCFALYSTTHAVLGVYRDLLLPLGLTYQQYLVLEVLRAEGPRTVGELASRLCIDAASASGLVRRLQATDLVTKERDMGDQRVIRVHRTSAAGRLERQLDEVPAHMAEASGLDQGEARELIGRLHTLRSALTESASADTEERTSS